MLREESLNEEQILEVTGLPAKPKVVPRPSTARSAQVEEQPEVPAAT